MKTFNISIEIQAEDKDQVTEKLQAFHDLQTLLSHEEFIETTQVIVENPDIIDFIKEVMPHDGQDLDLTDYIRIARKAFARFG